MNCTDLLEINGSKCGKGLRILLNFSDQLVNLPQFYPATVTMKISSDACDVLNERLVTLGLPSVVAMSQSDLNSDNISPLFLTNCDALLKELGRCDKSIPSNKTCTSLDQVCAFISVCAF